MQRFVIVIIMACCAGDAPGRDVILLADFEGEDFGAWQVAGEAFGTRPARGTLPGQQPVSGFAGRGLASSFHHGDRSTGTLTSPPFLITRRYLNFLLGGGRHAGQTGVRLEIGGQARRTATGNASTPADDEHLSWQSWDVAEFYGQEARLVVFDRHTGSWGHVMVDEIMLSDQRAAPLYADDALTRANSSVRGAAARAAADPARPLYHLRPHALWCNDPNGAIFHAGWYHLFFQHNPYGDRWQHMHWGHARSRDLVHWELLPIALAPTHERGETHCFSGCAALNAHGHPLLFYTSIGHPAPEQWAALARDDELFEWEKLAANPVLSVAAHGAERVYDWRDPFIFHHRGASWMVVGGNLNAGRGGQAAVFLYRAGNPELTAWEYRGVLFTHPDENVRNIECPNFIPLGERWLLIVSPHRRPEYFVGDFDAEAGRFAWTQRGLLDHGRAAYAPQVLREPGGRALLWAWIRGFPAGRGWNGCMTLPRVLTLDNDQLAQEPAPELARLRQEPRRWRRAPLSTGLHPLPFGGDTLEIEATLEPRGSRACGLVVRAGADGSGGMELRYEPAGSTLRVGEATIPLGLPPAAPVRLRLFLDKSVLEVYAEGRACYTGILDLPPDNLGLAAFAEGGDAALALECWPIRTDGVLRPADDPPARAQPRRP